MTAVRPSSIAVEITRELSARRWDICLTFSTTMSLTSGWLFRREVRTEGVMRSTRSRMKPAGISPVSTASLVAVTAPQLSCPSTTISGTPSTATLYSSEPRTASSITCPAVRTTKTSPRPTSKMISAASRESEQPKITANGFWVSTSDERREAFWFGCEDSPLTKRSLPSRRRRQARAGVRLVAMLTRLRRGRAGRGNCDGRAGVQGAHDGGRQCGEFVQLRCAREDHGAAPVVQDHRLFALAGVPQFPFPAAGIPRAGNGGVLGLLEQPGGVGLRGLHQCDERSLGGDVANLPGGNPAARPCFPPGIIRAEGVAGIRCNGCESRHISRVPCHGRHVDVRAVALALRLRVHEHNRQERRDAQHQGNDHADHRSVGALGRRRRNDGLHGGVSAAVRGAWPAAGAGRAGAGTGGFLHVFHPSIVAYPGA